MSANHVSPVTKLKQAVDELEAREKLWAQRIEKMIRTLDDNDGPNSVRGVRYGLGGMLAEICQ